MMPMQVSCSRACFITGSVLKVGNMGQGRRGRYGFGSTTFQSPLISRRGLPYSRGCGTHVEATNVYCSDMPCNSKWPAAHVLSPLNFLRLLTSRLPDSLFLSEPSVRKMSCGVPSSGRAKRALIMTSLLHVDGHG